jgi:hypothetical protein
MQETIDNRQKTLKGLCDGEIISEKIKNSLKIFTLKIEMPGRLN